MDFRKILIEHPALKRRRTKSEEKLVDVRQCFNACDFLQGLSISVFCAGSLARLEFGCRSDLDVFVLADSSYFPHSRLQEYTLFAKLIQINNLGFPTFSNDGEYLKVYNISDLKNRTGSRKDDSENLFTVRMLLMLESRPLIHSELYDTQLRGIVEHYYRDNKGKRSFRPLFLLNDILRYWRTLCLNYEERRHDLDRSWRKKNVNLKFSRMVTVFATILPLIAKPMTEVKDFFDLCQLSPLERLARGLSILGDAKLLPRWHHILNVYESFLTWKEDEDVEKYLQEGEHKERVRRFADDLSTFLYDALTHSGIYGEYRRYLVL